MPSRFAASLRPAPSSSHSTTAARRWSGSCGDLLVEHAERVGVPRAGSAARSGTGAWELRGPVGGRTRAASRAVRTATPYSHRERPPAGGRPRPAGRARRTPPGTRPRRAPSRRPAGRPPGPSARAGGPTPRTRVRPGADEPAEEPAVGVSAVWPAPPAGPGDGRGQDGVRHDRLRGRPPRPATHLGAERGAGRGSKKASLPPVHARQGDDHWPLPFSVTIVFWFLPSGSHTTRYDSVSFSITSSGLPSWTSATCRRSSCRPATSRSPGPRRSAARPRPSTPFRSRRRGPPARGTAARACPCRAAA